MTSLLRLCVFVLLALLAFAANSVLCRLALNDGLIDPAQFTTWRLLSGAVTLVLLCLFQSLKHQQNDLKATWLEGSWLSAFALFIYALGFSYAYVTLSTGMGALILFGAVQLTLILFAVWAGQKLVWLEWLGLAIAFAGFVYLVLPTLSSPSLFGFVLMTLAGVAWGLYTWRGKISAKPLFATTSNFVRTIPMIMVALLVIHFYNDEPESAQLEGIILAVTSGAIMSGLGYAIWYAVLPYLSASIAAVLQLLVPIIATIGGVFFAKESITLHLVIATLSVLGGVLLVIIARKRTPKNA
ncbi:threonine/homoserine efflux transporter RhtA [Marinomonas alcarazii]|uniref:Threonine/homoserine efflux transporter RhtA n=1 Tax=Marinomonas alcarazii TaxID=491949 RepID=A0A318V580_9GAMM|nr:DMT family transporter [Marinomonas alcarazii]PYF83203.1 threonine/homoserine efflux transporter RhtA [Marinomonas alcarazii]